MTTNANFDGSERQTSILLTMGRLPSSGFVFFSNGFMSAASADFAAARAFTPSTLGMHIAIIVWIEKHIDDV